MNPFHFIFLYLFVFTIKFSFSFFLSHNAFVIFSGARGERFDYRPTEDEMKQTAQCFSTLSSSSASSSSSSLSSTGGLADPPVVLNFEMTAPFYVPSQRPLNRNAPQPSHINNPQTEAFCQTLGIPDAIGQRFGQVPSAHRQQTPQTQVPRTAHLGSTSYSQPPPPQNQAPAPAAPIQSFPNNGSDAGFLQIQKTSMNTEEIDIDDASSSDDQVPVTQEIIMTNNTEEIDIGGDSSDST